MQTAELERASPTGRPGARADEVVFTAPTIDDGTVVHELVRACPPLDENSVYCNLLQCTHFAATCVLARRDGVALGWLSAHLPPERPGTVFVWQVAVAPKARGLGLGGRMLEALLQRDACRDARWLETTITAGNAASWALFEGFARRLGADLTHAPWLLEGAHLPNATEHLVRIGPLPASPQL